jgi:ParB family chromosome partitioning protein
MKMNNEQMIEIPIEKVRPNPNQPRKEFDKEKLNEFVENIRINGQLTPITVSKNKDFWEIVSGERRWRAMKILKIKTIKAIVKEYSDEKTKKIETIVENIQREDLKEEEKYNYFKDIMKTENIKTIGELSKKTGVATTSLKNLFDIYETRQDLEEDLQKEATSAVILETLRLPKEERIKVITYATKKEMGGRPVREFVKKLKNIDKEEVKEAVFNEEINIEQAERISKLKTPEARNKAIQEHKTIQMVEKGVERNIDNQMSAKEKKAFEKRLIQAGQMIMSFRNSVTDSYSSIEKSLKMIATIVPYISYMDDKQKQKLKIELGRLLEILERGSQITEQIEEKIQ